MIEPEPKYTFEYAEILFADAFAVAAMWYTADAKVRVKFFKGFGRGQLTDLFNTRDEAIDFIKEYAA